MERRPGQGLEQQGRDWEKRNTPHCSLINKYYILLFLYPQPSHTHPSEHKDLYIFSTLRVQFSHLGDNAVVWRSHKPLEP